MREQRVIIFLIILFSSCISTGTLGGFDKRTFLVSKSELCKAIDTLYLKHPEYALPDKWKDKDNWVERGYGFLEGRIFYLNEDPEEMYYVTFIGDSTMLANPKQISIAVRAVYSGGKKWMLESDFDKQERERIETRFEKKIISKLEDYTQVQAHRED